MQDYQTIELTLDSGILTVWLNDDGGIDHVVNDTGAAVNSTNQVTNIVSFP